MMVEQEFEEDESIHVIDVCFEVENILFRVPRQHFEESALFCDLFQLPVAENGTPVGVSKDHPLRLEGINQNDFKQLLRLMGSRRLQREVSLSLWALSEYKSALKLSTMWEFEKIRTLLIKEMSTLPIDAVEKIALARDYGVTEWLFPSLQEYARRVELITREDVDRLGLDYVLKIVQVRETIYGESPRRRHNFVAALQSAFKDEIKRVKFSDVQERTGQRQLPDESFCLVDMFFLVENCLFKGYRQYFEDSPVFRDMFQLPVAENAAPDGCSKDQPLRLDGIKKADFKQFLRFTNKSSHETTFSLPEWTSILKLSTMWGFTSIRQVAILEISKLPIDVVEKIVLARDYYISRWLLPSLNEYTKRQQSITIEDAERLGLDYILKIIQLREIEQYSRPGRVDLDFAYAVVVAFRDEKKKGRTYWSLQKSSTSPVVATIPRLKQEPLPQVHEKPPPPYSVTPETPKRSKTLIRKLFGKQ